MGDKVKLINCRVCGNEFNKYSRPWGLLNRATCSELCQEEYKKQQEAVTFPEQAQEKEEPVSFSERVQDKKEIKKPSGVTKLVILLFICLITGAIGAAVGGAIYNALITSNSVLPVQEGGTGGDPSLFILIGFAVGFFGPMIIYLDLA